MALELKIGKFKPEYVGKMQFYLAALDEFLDAARRGCVQSTIDYALIRTSDPLDAALAKYLSNRLGMHHRN